VFYLNLSRRRFWFFSFGQVSYSSASLAPRIVRRLDAPSRFPLNKSSTIVARRTSVSTRWYHECNEGNGEATACRRARRIARSSFSLFSIMPCRDNRFASRDRAPRSTRSRWRIGTEIVKKGSHSRWDRSHKEKRKGTEGTTWRVSVQTGANAGSALAASIMTRIEKKPHRYTTHVAQRALVVAPAVAGSLSCIAMMSAVESGPVSFGLVPNESSLSRETQRCGSRMRRIRRSSALRPEAASCWLADSVWLAGSDRKWMPIRGKRRSAMACDGPRARESIRHARDDVQELIARCSRPSSVFTDMRRLDPAIQLHSSSATHLDSPTSPRSESLPLFETRTRYRRSLLPRSAPLRNGSVQRHVCISLSLFRSVQR